MRSRITLIILSVTIVFQLIISEKLVYAAELPVVQFFTGNVKIYNKNTKKQRLPEVGLKVSPDLIIETGAKSFIELKLGNRKVTITEKKRIQSENIFKILKTKNSESILYRGFRGIFNKSTKFKNITQVLAVRGADKEESVEWATDDDFNSDNSNLVYDDMSVEYKRENYKKVIFIYKKNYKKIKSKTRGIKYLAAFSYLNLCRYNESLKLFRGLTKGPDDKIKSGSYFQTGMSYNCLLKYNMSNKYLTTFINKYSGDTQVPEAYLLRGINYLSLKKYSKAKKDFNRIINKYSKTSLAVEAKKILRQVK